MMSNTPAEEGKFIYTGPRVKASINSKKIELEVDYYFYIFSYLLIYKNKHISMTYLSNFEIKLIYSIEGMNSKCAKKKVCQNYEKI